MPAFLFAPKYGLAVCLLSAICFTSCSIDPDFNPIANIPLNQQDLTTKVTASLISGFVTDENDAPVPSASVEAGGIITYTDKYGYFEVKNTLVVQNAATVTVNKPTHFKAIKTFISAEGKMAFFRIKLMPKTIAGTINASSGGNIALPNGLIISLPPNAMVNANTNASYTGTVNVAARLISATDPDLERIMPGNLQGLNGSNNLQLLTTYGMAAIELTGSAGESLQLAPLKKAQLTLPIPAAIQSNAPASIPLWYFNETKGLWMEEGTALKTGNTYTGEVSHFSFWNCDYPGQAIHFECTLVNQNGQHLQYSFVKISRVINPYNAVSSYTDSAGFIEGPVLANENLQMQVYGNSSCGQPFYSQQFTTGNTNISLGTVTVNTSGLSANINGTVTNCNFNPVANGFIMMLAGNQYFRHPVVNGTFNFNAIPCSFPATVSLIAEDISGNQQSQTTAYSLIAGNNFIGNLQACGISTQQYIYYTINGITNYVYTSPADTFTQKTQYLPVIVNITGSHFGTPNGFTDIWFLQSGIAQGSSQPLAFFHNNQLDSPLTVINPIAINITEYGTPGQFIAGNFSGVLKGKPPAYPLYNVVCAFRVRRYQ